MNAYTALELIKSASETAQKAHTYTQVRTYTLIQQGIDIESKESSKNTHTQYSIKTDQNCVKSGSEAHTYTQPHTYTFIEHNSSVNWGKTSLEKYTCAYIVLRANKTALITAQKAHTYAQVRTYTLL